MNGEEFEREFRAARFHPELPCVVRWVEGDGKHRTFVAWSYKLRGLAVVLFGEYPAVEEVLLSDIREVY